MLTEPEPTNRSHVRQQRSTPEVHAEWRRGPRTRAWDDLWRWLLSDHQAEGEGHRSEGQLEPPVEPHLE